MDKDSILELQKIDSNCNECIFMQRNMSRFNESTEFQKKMQFDYFNVLKQKIIDKANHWRYQKGDLEKWNDLMIEVDKMKFQFDKSVVVINYGSCQKLNKEVQFIPNTIQLDTQDCFKHRKDT